MLNLMKSPQHPFDQGHPMLTTSPRCSLSCYGLSMHLPSLNERSEFFSKHVGVPVSDSSLHNVGTEPHHPGHLSKYHRSGFESHSSHVGSHRRSIAVPAPITTTKVSRKDMAAEHGSIGSTETTSISRFPDNSTTRSSSIWGDEQTSKVLDPIEGQLISGPPGIARRAKAHVPSACVNCKKKHLACETKRPCSRCVQNGKESSCVDVQHKKRGRPRLREDDGYRDLAARRQSFGEMHPSQPGQFVPNHHGRQRSRTYRELRSNPEAPLLAQRPRTSDSFQHGSHAIPNSFSYAPSIRPTSSFHNHAPTVLLTPDFIVAQHNRAFGDALSLPFTARGESLQDLVVPSERDKIRRIQTLILAEYDDALRSARARGDMNSINTMPAIEQLDITHATSGFQTRSEYWTFKLPRDQSRGFPVSISLARDGGHFVVLTLISSGSSLHSVTSPTFSNPFSLHTSSSGSVHSPPSYYTSQATYQRSRPHRQSVSEMPYPYFQPLAPSSLEDEMLGMQAPTSLAHYKASSPPRSVQLPYSSSRTTSSSPNSGSGSSSDIPRSDMSRSTQISPTTPRDSLKHLQLPPIRTTPTSEPGDRRRRHQTNTPSPARGSPHSASSKRKKRRRVEIEDMLH